MKNVEGRNKSLLLLHGYVFLCRVPRPHHALRGIGRAIGVIMGKTVRAPEIPVWKRHAHPAGRGTGRGTQWITTWNGTKRRSSLIPFLNFSQDLVSCSCPAISGMALGGSGKRLVYQRESHSAIRMVGFKSSTCQKTLKIAEIRFKIKGLPCYEESNSAALCRRDS